MKCAVFNCKNEMKNKDGKLSYFSFPKEKKLLKKWIQFCRQGKKKFNAKTWRVCMEHFSPDDIEGQLQFEMGLGTKRYLKLGSIPSVSGNKLLKQTDTVRLERLQKRSNKKLVSSLLLEAENRKEPQIESSVEERTEPDEALKEPQSGSSVEERIEPELNTFLTNNEEKDHLESLVKTLQKEVKSLKSENCKLNHNLLHMEKKHAYEIASLKEQLLKKEFECNNIEEKHREIFTEGQLSKLKKGLKKQKWTENDIAHSITLYSASAKGYKLLKKKKL